MSRLCPGKSRVPSKVTSTVRMGISAAAGRTAKTVMAASRRPAARRRKVRFCFMGSFLSLKIAVRPLPRRKIGEGLEKSAENRITENSRRGKAQSFPAEFCRRSLRKGLESAAAVWYTIKDSKRNPNRPLPLQGCPAGPPLCGRVEIFSGGGLQMNCPVGQEDFA